MDHYQDVDMYGMPYYDHDPLTGIVVTISIIIIFFLASWLYYKLKDL